MKRFSLLPLSTALLIVFACGARPAHGADTTGTSPHVLNLADFGGKPDSGLDANGAFQKAFAAIAQERGPVVLKIPKGRYELPPKTAVHLEYYFTNTLDEGSDETKTIGLYLKGLKNLTIEGNGASLYCNGRMTLALLDSCENITIKHLNFDFVRPTMSELKVTAVSGNTVDYQVHPDSKYTIEQGKVFWVGEGWKNQGGTAQQYDPVSDTTWRCDDPVKGAKSAEEISPNHLRLTYDQPFHIAIGQIFQIRDGVRDGVGICIAHSRNTTLSDLGMHYMHGLGIVGQASDTITLQRVDCSPRKNSGRTNAGFADMMHFACCRGKISILNCNFSGAQDDAVNVHGIHFQIQSSPGPNQLLVSFKNNQTRGFNPFRAGDEIDFVNADTLIPFGTVHLTNAELKDPHNIVLTLDQAPPAGIRLAKDVVEDASATPEVEIRNCHIARIPTRAFLLSSRRKTLVENNTVTRLPMSCVSIGDDARDWFEAGMVRDVLIQGNHFVEDRGPVIIVSPALSQVTPQAPVHQNIVISKNDFKITNGTAVTAVAVKNLEIIGNTFSVETPGGPLFDLTGCLQVSIRGNKGLGQAKNVAIHQMDKKELSLQPDLTLGD